jgi:general secretion pathway protein A
VSKDKPSAHSKASDRVLETEAVLDALTRMTDSLGAREPFLLVTGESGTGKTTLVRAVIERWGAKADVAFVADPAMTRTELLEEIVRRFGTDPPAGASKPQLLGCLETAIADAKANKRVPVIVIDDAHEVSPELLGELRLLTNVSEQAGGPLEIMLVGLPVLEERLAEPAFAQVRQRVSVHCVTHVLSQHQTRRYLHEVVSATPQEGASQFPKKASREIHVFSGGVPRTIQALATEALRVAASAGERAVAPVHVRTAAETLSLVAGSEEREGDAAHSAAAVSAKSTQAPAERPATPPAASNRSREAAAPAATSSLHANPTGEAAAAPPSALRKAVETAAGASSGSGRKADDAGVGTAEPAVRPMDEIKPPGDPVKVSEWVGKFISPEEPRFGDLLGTGVDRNYGAFDDESWMLEQAAEARAAADSAPAPRRRRAPRMRAPQGRLSHAKARKRRAIWMGAVLIALLVGAALMVLIGPVRRVVFRAEASQASAEGSTQAKEQVAAVDAETSAQDHSTPERQAKAGAESARLEGGRNAASASRTSPAPARSAESPSPATTPSSRTLAASSENAEDPVPGRLYALDVGTHYDVGEAGVDRERLMSGTGLQGWLVKHTANGATSYRVVLGIFSTRERAESSANLLLSRHQVTEATVIPLPPRSQRF